MLFAGKQALSNVKNLLTNVGGNVFCCMGGVEPSDLPSSPFVAVFFCIICEGLRFFFGSLSLGVFSPFVMDGSHVGVP